jgi:hypothetical protein
LTELGSRGAHPSTVRKAITAVRFTRAFFVRRAAATHGHESVEHLRADREEGAEGLFGLEQSARGRQQCDAASRCFGVVAQEALAHGVDHRLQIGPSQAVQLLATQVLGLEQESNVKVAPEPAVQGQGTAGIDHRRTEVAS